MNDISSLILHNGYVVVCLVVFAEAIGVPVPGALALVAGGAAAAAGTLYGPAVALLAIAAMLSADSVLYLLGRHMGWTLLRFLCRVSADPEGCVLHSAESFYKRGRLTLLIDKFIPGVSTMAAPLAGSMKMPFSQFLGLDFLGAGLYALSYGAVGFIFRDFVGKIVRGFRAAGHVVEIAIIIAVIAFIGYRVSLYWKQRADRLVPRVAVQILAAKLQTEGPEKDTAGRRAQPWLLQCGCGPHSRLDSSRAQQSQRRNNNIPSRQGNIPVLHLPERSDERVAWRIFCGKGDLMHLSS